jgi:hypothetical protein
MAHNLSAQVTHGDQLDAAADQAIAACGDDARNREGVVRNEKATPRLSQLNPLK